MGNSPSIKPSIVTIITYEEALTRISNEEFEHLESSYDELLCVPDKVSFVTKAFLGFPEKFAERLFKVFAPYNHLTLQSLVCGVVILLRGSRQEKLQLLFYLMSSDGVKVTQENMTTCLTDWGIETPKQISLLFTVSDACTVQHFFKWMEKFNPVLGVYDWVLDNSGDGVICSGVRAFQTYHQFLAEQASFTEKQVTALEKNYRKLRRIFSRSKRFDIAAMYQCLHPLYTYEFTQHFFHALDLNQDGNIDCRELVIGLSAILEGEDSFGKFVFDMFNKRGEGDLNQPELKEFNNVIGTFCLVSELKLDADPELPVDTIQLQEFIQWCNNSCTMYKFLNHLKSIVYVVFAVKPDLSFNIIRQWMEMESTMKLITGKTYYIANNEWFNKASGGLVNNSPILAPEHINNGTKSVPSITTEGGTLRQGLIQGIDYQIISQVLWCTLEDWYGCDTAICRRARLAPDGVVILELFPLKLNFYQQPSLHTRTALEALNTGPVNLQASIEFNNTMDLPRHVHSYTGVFYSDDTLTSVIQFLSQKLKLGREDLRLWKMLPNQKLVLLDESDDKNLDSLGIKPLNNILIEIRNTDMSWPEEVANIVNQNRVIDRRAPTARVNGTTGLNNLGNTCFMNSSIQCLSNTRALSVYFLKETHHRELNQNNPDSLNGLLALRYGTLIKNLWSCSSRTIAPLKMRWTIARFAPQFSGFGQHDAQELLAFLLDGLHEDLNRVTCKPYTEITDSGDRHDSDVAEEFWANHVSRNRSIIVDLFHGQLKSTLKCTTCGFRSVRFDPFSFLSLPLPENENVIIEVFVVRLDPQNLTTQYCLWLNNEYTMKHVKKRLTAKIPAVKHFLFVTVENSVVKRVVGIDESLRNIDSVLYAFELPGSGEVPDQYAVTYSRCYVTIDKYFFDWQHRQVNLFGTPFIVPTEPEPGTSQSVTVRSRIISYIVNMYNLDEDFIEDLNNKATVRKVKQGGRDCCICPWKELCYGCKLVEDADLGECKHLTVDWSSAVVHLIRQFDDDLTIIEDQSVVEAKKRQSQPVDLSLCLNSFTKEEEIAEWFCKKCDRLSSASKKLDIWRLPPFLIIHLKRFSFQGGQWIKCKRTVSFPDSFDPSPFLVQSSQVSLYDRLRTESVNRLYTVLVEGDEDNYDEVSIASMDDDEVVNSNNRNPLEQHKDSLSYIVSCMKTNNSSSKKNINDSRPFYDLYAVTAHTGLLSGGHYVSFSMNPNRQWYYYNDSQVKKTTKKRVLSEPAYILFYERKNLKIEDLMPSYSMYGGTANGEAAFSYDASMIMKDVLNSAQEQKKSTCSLQ